MRENKMEGKKKASRQKLPFDLTKRRRGEVGIYMNDFFKKASLRPEELSLLARGPLEEHDVGGKSKGRL
jgi:hypothetical protein